MGTYEMVALAVGIATLIVNTVSMVVAIMTLWVMIRGGKGRHRKG